MTDEKLNVITENELQNGQWLFGYNTELKTGSEMIFTRDGKISKYDHPNERKYRIDDGILYLISQSDQVTSVFDKKEIAFGTIVLLGRKKEDEAYTVRLTLLPDEIVHDDCESPLRKSFRREMFTMGWSIGRGSYGGIKMIEKHLGQLSIGSFCSFADITLAFGNHRIDCATSYPFGVKKSKWPGYPMGVADHYSNGKIVIGNDVWIGSGAMVFSGVKIGDGAVIGARTIVTKDVPPYAVVVGTPAKILKYRFSEKQISDLLRIQWWNWSIEKINEFLPVMMSSNIDQFIQTATEEDINLREVLEKANES